jgi:predicted deacylase
METWVLGDGEPEVAVVGAIHGDEPCGAVALRRLRRDPPAVDEPVLCVIANEAALERGVRYVDEDCNRAFPGDPDAETHEGRLAARLVDALDDRLTLSLHSTQSHPEPFGIVSEVTGDPRFVTIPPRLPIEAIVEGGRFEEGRLLESVPTIEVECGHQGSDAAVDNAVAVVDAFLRATGALPGPDPPRTLPVLRLRRQIPKGPADEYAVHVDNLDRVPADVPFASADGEHAVADEPFYPVLLSADGYESVFGYEADRVGIVGPSGWSPAEEPDGAVAE